jgi:hypothetical protein
MVLKKQGNKKLVMLSVPLLVFAAGSVNAQSVDLSTGTAVMANGLDSNGNVVQLLDPKTFNNAKQFGNAFYVYYNAQDGREHVSQNSIVPNGKGTGYASMQRGTREVDLARGIYANNPKYDGVIDYGITRDANWTVYYTATGATPAQTASANFVNNRNVMAWGNANTVRGLEGALKNAVKDNRVGYIDSRIEMNYNGRTSYGTTAEIYGSSTVNSNGVGYQAGLKYLDKGTGVIGASAGLYYDEAGQYSMDASGNITWNGNRSGGNNAASIVYDDWNQHGIVLTGADILAYTVGFDANGADTIISGEIGYLGYLQGVYVNGNLIDASLLNLDGGTYGNTILNGVGIGEGVVGSYAMNLDLSEIDASFWNADGHNNLSFMIVSVTPWQLQLQSNDVSVIGSTTNPYAHPSGIVAGFNYFSGNIQYGSTSVIPEPETWSMLLAGLGIIGATVRRRRLLNS